MKIDRSMFGDMAIKDLSPKDANSGGRIIKNLRICGSGLYEYHVSEAPLMGLAIPEDYTGDTFKIYRSPKVLEDNKELYARVPIITGHHVRVNTSNAKQLAVGMVGDTVQSEIGEDGELYLYTTGTIITGDGIAAYEQYGELSVGYDPIVKWEPGEYKGQPYQAVLTGFNEINHLLICKTARGGHQCMIMDSLDTSPLKSNNGSVFDKMFNGGRPMGIFKKIFAKPAEKKMLTGDAKVISALLQSVKVGADCKTQVEVVKSMIGDSADETLKGYFEDLTGDEVSKADKETLGKAIDVVDTYCQKLFGDEVEPASPTTPSKEDASKPAPEAPKKESEDKDKKSENGDGCNTTTPPQTGDAIDYDRIINGVVAKLKPAEKKPEELPGDAMEVSRLDALLNGDAKHETSTEDIVKGIWG